MELPVGRAARALALSENGGGIPSTGRQQVGASVFRRVAVSADVKKCRSCSMGPRTRKGYTKTVGGSNIPHVHISGYGIRFCPVKNYITFLDHGRPREVTAMSAPAREKVGAYLPGVYNASFSLDD